MLIAALFTINKRWKHPSVHQQMNKLCSSLFSHKKKRKEMLTHAIKWMDPEQSETDHSQKDKYYMTEII